jgi:hypothetical protein
MPQRLLVSLPLLLLACGSKHDSSGPAHSAGGTDESGGTRATAGATARAGTTSGEGGASAGARPDARAGARATGGRDAAAGSSAGAAGSSAGGSSATAGGSPTGDAGSSGAGGGDADGVGKWGRWIGTTSDGTDIRLSVGWQGTVVSQLSMSYPTDCGTAVLFWEDVLPIDASGFAWSGPEDFGVALSGSFAPDATATGSYSFEGGLVTTDLRVCIEFVNGVCQQWATSSSSCESSGAGTWTAAPDCVADVTMTPPRLAIVLDISGSMGDAADGSFLNTSERWVPVRDGLLDFLADPGAVLQASLHLFPAGVDVASACEADYSVPQVGLTSLPDSAAFAPTLGAVTTGGGTPMLSAEVGAASYLLRKNSEDGPAPSAVVLITDGEPVVYDPSTMTLVQSCAPVGSEMENTVQDVMGVAEAAFEVCPYVSTHVITLGDLGDTLSPIAAAGGTQVVSVNVGDPAATRSEVAGALRAIAARM